MQYGIYVPTFGDYSNLATLAELARDAETAGWDGFFLWDHIVWPTPWPGRGGGPSDPWLALAVIATSTERIRLGPLVTPISRRRPWKLARETVTLDHLSGGRLILGVGLGYFQDEEFAALGEVADPKERATRLDEGLEVLTGLWTGEPFSYSGKHYQIKGAQFLPRPVQSPRIPIWVAGAWPNKAPLRRAARWDGVFPINRDAVEEGLRPEEMEAVAAYVRSHRTRDEPFDVAVGGWTPGRAVSEAAEIVAPYAAAGCTWWLEDLNPWRGSLEENRARVRRGPPKVSLRCL